jgi:integrase
MDLGTQSAAANDSDYRAQRHRTLPIPASITPIANYPTKLRIFKTHASRYWQVRCFLKGRTYTQSLKTTHKQAAIHQAKHFFHIKIAELYGERLPDRGEQPNKFADLVQAALAYQQGRVKRGELSAASLGILRNRLQNAILPFFGEMPLEQIGYQQVSDYIQHLSDQSLTTVTIQQHLVAIRKVLHYAVGVGKLSAVPKFPAVTVTSKPRGSYSLTEYLTLVRTARRMIGQSASRSITDKSRRGSRAVSQFAKVSPDLHWLIRFMVNGFVRPSDIKLLQHKHVTIVRGRHTYLRLNLPETKRHDKPIVTLQPAVVVYERVLAWQLKHGFGRPDDYVFLPDHPNRSLVLEAYRWQFNFVQQAAGIGVNAANGQHRTLYSLRHSAMTFRLLYGRKVDLLTLAKNARTSVEMVERFYASNLTAEMNIDLLHGKR